jgi:hypothetical protein
MASLIIEKANSILPNMSMLQIQTTTTVAAQKKTTQKQCGNTQYVLIYEGLSFLLNNGNIPVSKYRITNNKTTIDNIIKNGFVNECRDKKQVVSEYSYHNDTKYYVVSQKGMEYVEIFEKLKGLFD